MYWYVFFFNQKTAYEMRISDWSSDVCSSDLRLRPNQHPHNRTSVVTVAVAMRRSFFADFNGSAPVSGSGHWTAAPLATACNRVVHGHQNRTRRLPAGCDRRGRRSEEHTSALQSLMRSSYAVFCLKKNKK